MHVGGLSVDYIVPQGPIHHVIAVFIEICPSDVTVKGIQLGKYVAVSAASMQPAFVNVVLATQAAYILIGSEISLWNDFKKKLFPGFN